MMVQNMEKVIKRGEAIEVLVDKSAVLTTHSERFRSSSGKVITPSLLLSRLVLRSLSPSLRFVYDGAVATGYVLGAVQIAYNGGHSYSGTQEH